MSGTPLEQHTTSAELHRGHSSELYQLKSSRKGQTGTRSHIPVDSAYVEGWGGSWKEMFWKCYIGDAAVMLGLYLWQMQRSQGGSDFKKNANVGAGCSAAASARECWSW